MKANFVSTVVQSLHRVVFLMAVLFAILPSGMRAADWTDSEGVEYSAEVQAHGNRRSGALVFPRNNDFRKHFHGLLHRPGCALRPQFRDDFKWHDKAGHGDRLHCGGRLQYVQVHGQRR